MEILPQSIKLDHSLYCVIPLQDGKTFLATSGHQIWKINSETGAMSVHAGKEEGGYRDGLSQYASFNDPSGLALMQDGCVVVADCCNHSLRLISPCGRFVGTLAGFNGGVNSNGYLDGDAQAAQLGIPAGVCVGLSMTPFTSLKGVTSAFVKSRMVWLPL